MARKVPTIPTPPGTKSPVPGLDRLRRRPPGSRIEETISEETEEKRERRARQIPGLPGALAPAPAPRGRIVRLSGPAGGGEAGEGGSVSPGRVEGEGGRAFGSPGEEPIPPFEEWRWQDVLRYAHARGVLSLKDLARFQQHFRASVNLGRSPLSSSDLGISIYEANRFWARLQIVVAREYGWNAVRALARSRLGWYLPPDLPQSERLV